MLVHSDRTFDLDRSPDDVWAAMASTHRYRSWWPWLRQLDSDGLEAGARWTCVIRPPLPYVLRLRIDLDDVRPARHVSASVSGDIHGRASVTLQSAPGGQACTVRLESSLSPARGVLRQVSRWAPGVARFGHDWVIDTGLRQFRRRALDPTA